MRVLADSDLLLEFFANREGRVEAAEKLLEMVQSQQIEMYLTEQCLDKLRFYLSKGDDRFGENLIANIEAMLNILPISQNLIQEARTYPLPDFESAVEIACATAMNLDAVITQNQHNFAGATLPVWSVDELLEQQQLVEILEQQQYTESKTEWSELHLNRVRRYLERSTQVKFQRWLEMSAELKWMLLEHIEILQMAIRAIALRGRILLFKFVREQTFSY